MRTHLAFELVVLAAFSEVFGIDIGSVPCACNKTISFTRLCVMYTA